MASEQTVAEVDASHARSYTVVSAAMMVVYNHVITIHEEVAQYRRPKLSGAFVIYMANRYLVLAGVMYSLPFWLYVRAPALCAAGMLSINTISLVTMYIPPAVFSALRAWVLLRSIPVALVILLCSASPLVVNAVLLHWVAAAVDPVRGCIARGTSSMPGHPQL
ncbi:hypothetical protein BD413DRAFT_71563 [Trametes elegans]|nr:hypothetical protein BD413DRAFT_71563 [Trametes elegans]